MKVKRMSLVEGMDVHISDYPNFHKSGNVKGMKEKSMGKMFYEYNELLGRMKIK